MILFIQEEDYKYLTSGKFVSSIAMLPSILTDVGTGEVVFGQTG